jgi:hypothetical protein
VIQRAMQPVDAACAFAAVFIAAMVWLRTRMHYRRGSAERLVLTRAGRCYFAAVFILLALGWPAAPALARALAPAAAQPVALTRGVWFLAIYFLCIPAHRLLRARGVAVFRIMTARSAAA